jgi:8-oxo-dGTP pyrophosphatase MutT (NUDIX family)
VLVPLVQRDDGLHVLLTRRTDHLRDHAGQISFPGGRSEPDDADPAATALREAEEEVGLPRDRVEVIGELPAYTTVTHFVVTPVVALVQPPFELALDRLRGGRGLRGAAGLPDEPGAPPPPPSSASRAASASSCRCPGRAGRDGVQREYFIWGATAAMLRNLYRFLAA